MNEPDDDAWFAAKSFGYGSGLPIAWQGWAVLGLYLLVLLGASQLTRFPGALARGGSFAVIIAATAILLVVTARKTRGGWKWRWGRRD